MSYFCCLKSYAEKLEYINDSFYTNFYFISTYFRCALAEVYQKAILLFSYSFYWKITCLSLNNKKCVSFNLTWKTVINQKRKTQSHSTVSYWKDLINIFMLCIILTAHNIIFIVTSHVNCEIISSNPEHTKSHHLSVIKHPLSRSF